MIKTLPTETLQEALLAVQDLRRKYKGEPLIRRICPWIWFEKNTYSSQPIPDRLRRIDRWENALVEELAARRCL